jgi:transposase
MRETQEVNPRNTTLRCADCGTVAAIGTATLEITCDACGRAEDQDCRAARNLLAAGASDVVAGGV